MPPNYTPSRLRRYYRKFPFGPSPICSDEEGNLFVEESLLAGHDDSFQKLTFKDRCLVFQREDTHNDSHFWHQTSYRSVTPYQKAELENYYAQIVDEHRALIGTRLLIFDVGAGENSYLPSRDLFNPAYECWGFGIANMGLLNNRDLIRFFEVDLNSPLALYFRREDDILERLADKVFPSERKGQVDMIMLNFVYPYLTAPLPVIKRMKKMLKVGGKIHVVYGRDSAQEKTVRLWNAYTMPLSEEFIIPSLHQRRIRNLYINRIFEDCGGFMIERFNISPTDREDYLYSIVATKLAS